MQPRSHYDTLGIAPDADARTIKTAYFRLVRKYPPETHPKEFQQLRAAYETLSDEEARRHYDNARTLNYGHFGSEDSALMAAAVRDIDAGEYQSAIPLLRNLVERHERATEPRLRLLHCLMELGEFEDALRHAAAFAQLFPERIEGHLARGHALLALGQRTEARQAFDDAQRVKPEDVRPVRAQLEVDLLDGNHAGALDFLDERLATAAPALAFSLQLEKVSLLNAIGDFAAARQLVEQLRATITPERADELGFLIDREAALLIDKSQPEAAEALLANAVGPQRTAALKPLRLPISELPEASRTWLLAQRTEPEFLSLPKSAPSTWLQGLMAVVLAATSCAGASFLLTSHLATTAIATVVGLCGAYGVWASFDRKADRRASASPFGRFVTIHPRYVIDVDIDAVELFPLLTLTSVDWWAQSGKAMVRARFGPVLRNFEAPSPEHAHRFAELVDGLSARLLQVMHDGQLSADVGADFVSPDAIVRAQPAQTEKTPPRQIAGGFLLVALLVAGVWSFVASTQIHLPTNQADLRELWARTTPLSNLHEAAHEALKEQQRTVSTALEKRWPELSSELNNTEPTHALRVLVSIHGSASDRLNQQADLKTIALDEQREAALLKRVQYAFDKAYGGGWVTFERTVDGASEEPLVTLAYEADFDRDLRIDAKVTKGASSVATIAMTVSPDAKGNLPVHELWSTFAEKLSAALFGP